MNKIMIAVSALSLLSAASVAALAASPDVPEAHGQPVNQATLPADPAHPHQDLLSVWANEGAITDQDANRIRAQLKAKGDGPGTKGYDEAAGAYAFPNQSGSN